MKKLIFAGIMASVLAPTTLPVDVLAQTGKSPAGSVPVFQVDSSWLKLPNDWVLG